jgi:uncharacterized protein YggE
MSIAPLDLLHVVVDHEEEVAATHADLFVSVKGSSTITGAAALTQAREVAALVAAVKAVGVAEADIQVRSARVEVASGLITKSSSATYGLKLRLRKLEAFGDVLGAITSQRNAQVQQVEWGYLEDDARRDGWLVRCAEKASARARLLAAAMGVEVLGVHAFYEGTVPPQEGPELHSGYAGQSRSVKSYASGSMSSEELGLQVTHTRKVGVQVTVQFRIGQK